MTDTPRTGPMPELEPEAETAEPDRAASPPVEARPAQRREERAAPPKQEAAFEDETKRGFGVGLMPKLLGPVRAVLSIGLGGWLFVATVAWVTGAIVYLDYKYRLRNVPDLVPADELGMFISGVMAPVIMAWIALAYARHARVVTRQLQAMEEAAVQARSQAVSVGLSEHHLRRETFMRLTSSYLEEMGRHAALLAVRAFEIDEAEQARLWGRFAQGDREIFFRRFFDDEDAMLGEKIERAVKGSPAASKSAHLFCGFYQVFMMQAAEVDEGNLMIEAYRSGYLGDLNRILARVVYGTETPFG